MSLNLSFLLSFPLVFVLLQPWEHRQQGGREDNYVFRTWVGLFSFLNTCAIPSHSQFEHCSPSRVTHPGCIEVLPHVQMLFFPVRLTHVLRIWETGSDVLQVALWAMFIPVTPLGTERMNSLSCKGISCCRMPASVSNPSCFSCIFFPWHQSKNYWQVLKRQPNALAHTKDVSN